jgi:BirA family biotin operon repressor/biotin-[acetyl-CoA-carboxylase] ligase
VRYFSSITSTNDEALDWAAQGASNNSLVVADTQTRGRGRFNRQWITQPGAALAFSMILQARPAELEQAQLFSPLAALAICMALEEDFSLQPQIKWPNDILLNSQKTAGILVESIWNSPQSASIVIGVGINIAPSSVPAAEELLFPATCVETVLGKSIDRQILLVSVLKKITLLRSQLGKDEFINNWQKRLAFLGQWVKIEKADRPDFIGRLQGIDRQGNLHLQTEVGDEVAISVGEVHLRPLSSHRQQE